MRKIFVLAILFSLSMGLKYFGLLADAHNSVLLAIGVVLLSAYILSEIGSSLKLPRVTGYILTGLLLGPYALGILSKQVVGEIEMFKTLAIGLIAISAGLELHFQSLKRVIIPILTTSFFKLLFLGIGSVAAIFIANEYFFDFGMGLGLQLAALALVFGALSLGTSPAISLAVISEMKAKSRMSQMVLGSAIVKDVLVTIALAITISLAKSLGGSGDSIAEGFYHLGEELGLSFLAGIILGLIFIGYLRFIRQEMFIFIAVIILATAEISAAVHLELLLVFIVAGIIVRNFSKDEEILHHALEKVSLPVFVVFFTNVGAGLNLQTTWQFLPIALLLFASRTFAFIGAGFLAGRIHNESPSMQRRIWLGYLPQAGVTLGLIAIASRGLPQYADLINNIGIGLVTLNLLVGPIALRLVLRAEEPEAESEKEEAEALPDSSLNGKKGQVVAEPIHASFADFEEMLNEQTKEISDPKLAEHFHDLSVRLFEIFKKQQLLPQKNILTNFVDELGHLGHRTEEEIVEKIDDHFRKMGEKGRDIYNSIRALQKELDQIPVTTQRPIPIKTIRFAKGDSPWIVAKKVSRRPYYWFDRSPMREVPARKLAKYNLERLIGSFSLQMINSWYRLLGQHINIFQGSLETHSFDSGEILSQIEKQNSAWVQAVQSDFVHEYERMARRWVRQLNRVNTVYLSDSDIRYSNVEPEIKEQFELAKKNSLLWEEKFVYCRNRLKVVVQSALLSTTLESLLIDKFFVPINDSKDNADKLVQEVFDFFSNIENQIKNLTDQDLKFFQSLKNESQTFASEHLQADIKTKYVRGSFRLLNRDISINLRRSLPKEEGSFQIASEQTPAHQVQSPQDIMVKKINLYELFEQSILINFLPVIEEKIEGVSNYLESLLLEMEQAFSIINYNLEAQIGGDVELNVDELTDSILSTIGSERDKISELHNGLIDYVTAAKDTAEKLMEECQQEVQQGIERFSVVTTAKNQFRQRLYQGVQGLRNQVKKADEYVDGQYQRLKNIALQQSEREIDRTLTKKIMTKTLDTTTIRQFVQETYDIDQEKTDLPRVYYRLFGLDPIQDKRFYVAHQSQWRHFQPFTNDIGFSESQKILIIGDRGMGKSSLINVAQMDLKSDRLIRLEAEDHKGPVASLAQSLGCLPSSAAILSALRKAPATLILDNVDQMLNKKNLDQFEVLFDIIKQSPYQTHWILSITKFNLDPLDRSYKIRSLFNKLIDLHDVTAEEAKETLLGRHRLSGLGIEYPKSFVSEWAMRLGLSTEDEMFFRVLFERSHGHLRHLIYLWLRSLVHSDGKDISMSLHQSVERGLPMIHEFSTIQKYILAHLYNYHHVSMQTLSDSLGASYSIIDNETQYLEHCGLITSRGIDHTTFTIPNHLVFPVGQELKKEGVLHEGFNKLRG